jgi:hypothetical protein
MKTMELEHFPKYDDAIKSIEKLQKEGFPKFDGKSDVESFVKTIEDILSKEFGILINHLTPFKHKDFSLKFFRVREFDTFQNISLIREHSYPPLNLTKMGRCNFPKYPVFYCSNDAMTALLEVARNYGKLDKRFCISKWELTGKEEELIFQNFLQAPLPPENHFNVLQKSLRERINEPFEKSLNEGLDEERKKGLLEYLTFLDDNFIADDNYSLSASLAHRALYINHNYRADILMYPSVQTNFRGVNMALNPNFVENNLKMTRLYEVSLENYNPKTGKINVTFYRYAEIKKNIIWWSNLSPDDKNYESIIKEDFGHLMKNKSLENTFKEIK